MSKIDAHEIRSRYVQQYGEPNAAQGMTITITQSQKGNWVVTRWYQKSSWVDDVAEFRVVYTTEGEYKTSSRIG